METRRWKGSYSCWDVSIQLTWLLICWPGGLVFFPGSSSLLRSLGTLRLQKYITYYQYEENLVGCTMNKSRWNSNTGSDIHARWNLGIWERDCNCTIHMYIHLSRVGKKNTWCLLLAHVSSFYGNMHTTLKSELTNFSLPAHCETHMERFEVGDYIAIDGNDLHHFVWSDQWTQRTDYITDVL